MKLADNRLVKLAMQHAQGEEDLIVTLDQTQDSAEIQQLGAYNQVVPEFSFGNQLPQVDDGMQDENSAENNASLAEEEPDEDMAN